MTNNTVIAFQPVSKTAPLSETARAAINKTVLQFYVQNQPQDDTAQGITALYERLSHEDGQEGESNSIANQKKILERYARDHGYTGVRHYEDDGYSGTNFNRPGFQEMLADVKAGKISRVIVKDMSRFGRDYLQVGMYTDILFLDFCVHFIAVNDGVDSTRGDNEFTAIRNVFNEMYARDTSKKIGNVALKGKSGETLPQSRPIGYRKDRRTKEWMLPGSRRNRSKRYLPWCNGMGRRRLANGCGKIKVLNPTAYSRARFTYFNKPRRPYKWQ